jgi:hypothetical protein
MLQHFADRFGQTRDILPDGGQIRGDVAFAILGHGHLHKTPATSNLAPPARKSDTDLDASSIVSRG